MCGLNNIYSRLKTRYGFGVHSPWAYDIITSLIMEKSTYYAYNELEDISERAYANLPRYSNKTNRFLFRMVNYFSPSSILEIGTGSGVSAVYLSVAKKSTPCVTTDTPHDKQSEVKCFLSPFTNVKPLFGSFQTIINDFFQHYGTLEFVHVAHTEKFCEVVETLLPMATPTTLIVVESVDSKPRAAWWKKLIKDNRVGVTFEYKGVGLLFFDFKRYKQNYLL